MFARVDKALALAASIAAVSPAIAADIPARLPPPAPLPVELPAVVPDWTVDAGLREWISFGRFRYNLFDPFVSSQLNSRLTYKEQQAISSEAFLRLDHRLGFFARGFIGGGSIVRGHMNDEDFPPAVAPYSNTLQSSRDGALRYGVLDIGYALWTEPWWRIDGFVGYTHWNERYNTYGCLQIGGANGICNSFPPPLTPISGAFNGLDEDVRVNAARIGLAAQATFGGKTTVKLEGAYLRGGLDGQDFHNFRPTIRGIRQEGVVNGFQLQASVDYEILPNFRIGAGARWWRVESPARMHWEETVAGILAGGVPPSSAPIALNRYGMFLQASYRFGGNGLSSPLWSGPKRDWTGFHVGLSGGAGFNSASTDFTPTSPTALAMLAGGALPRSMSYGAFGSVFGAQAGFDVQGGMFVGGVEADISHTNVAGSGTWTDGAGFSTSLRQNLSWLGTVRARTGAALGPAFVYATLGLGVGGVESRTAFSIPVLTCDVNYCSSGAASATALGVVWGAGAEIALDDRLSLKGEYLVVDLGRRGVQSNDVGLSLALGVPVNYTARPTFATQFVRFGMNYRFGGLSPFVPLEPAAVVAKY